MASIQLLHDFAGRLTREQRIWPGVYDADDPTIFGLADYLVANGHAVWVDAPPAPVVLPSFAADNMVEFGTQTAILDEQPVESFEVVDEIEHQGRKVQRRKSQG
jgi:hypothetical protein